MAISEDVIIRILTDASSGVREIKQTNAELKKMGKSAQLSAKNIAGIGAAFGGISAVIDLGVKAIANYVAKIKEASDEYITLAKESGDYYNEAIDAIDELEAAENRLAEARARNADENLEGWREWRAEQKDAKAFLIENNDLINFFATQLARSGVAAEEVWTMAVQKAEEYIDEVSTLEGGDLWLQQAADIDEVNSRTKDLIDTNEELRKQREKANAAFDVSLRNIENATAQLGLSGTDLLEVQRDQAIEIIKLNEYYKDHQDALIAATNEYYDQKIAIEETSQRQKEALADLEAYNELIDAIFDDSDLPAKAAQNDPFKVWQDSIQSTILAANVMANALTNAIDIAFGDSKAAAIANAIINQALAITNLWATAPWPIPPIVTPLMVATLGAEIAKIQSTDYALGTPPGGFTVPPGYENDNYGINVKSGETVTVDRPGSGGGEMLYASISIDGYEFGKVMTRVFKDRKAVVPAEVVR